MPVAIRLLRLRDDSKESWRALVYDHEGNGRMRRPRLLVDPHRAVMGGHAFDFGSEVIASEPEPQEAECLLKLRVGLEVPVVRDPKVIVRLARLAVRPLETRTLNTEGAVNHPVQIPSFARDGAEVYFDTVHLCRCLSTSSGPNSVVAVEQMTPLQIRNEGEEELILFIYGAPPEQAGADFFDDVEPPVR